MSRREKSRNCDIKYRETRTYLALFSATWGGKDVGGGGGWVFGAGPLLSESLSLLSSVCLAASPSRCEGTPLGENRDSISEFGLTLRCGLWNRKFSWLASVTYFSLCLRRRNAGVHPVKFSSSVELVDVNGEKIGRASGNVAQRRSSRASQCAVKVLPLIAKICQC